MDLAAIKGRLSRGYGDGSKEHAVEHALTAAISDVSDLVTEVERLLAGEAAMERRLITAYMNGG